MHMVVTNKVKQFRLPSKDSSIFFQLFCGVTLASNYLYLQVPFCRCVLVVSLLFLKGYLKNNPKLFLMQFIGVVILQISALPPRSHILMVDVCAMHVQLNAWVRTQNFFPLSPLLHSHDNCPPDILNVLRVNILK